MNLNKVAWPKPGKYIIGVSGGIDSMVLLHLLARRDEYKLIPVYVDHGWRDTSADWDAVKNLSRELKLDPVRIELNLSSKSEEEAREQRYLALRNQAQEHEAIGIITGHHHDDLVETVLINVIRGTGRHGLTPFGDSSIIRPLLQINRCEIEQYAKDNHIQWVEDPSNKETHYLRNRVRHNMIPKLSDSSLEIINKQIGEAKTLNQDVDELLAEIIEKGEISDTSINLPVKEIANQTTQVIQELIVFAARKLEPGVEINRRTVEQLAIDIKNSRVNNPRAVSKRLFAIASHGTFTIAFKAR